MTHFFLILAAFSFVALNSVTTYATYYWASATGSSAAACSSIDSTSLDVDPGVYGTIGQAARCATVAGDTAVVKGGTGTFTNADDYIDLANSGNIDPGQFVSGTSKSVRTTLMGHPAHPRPLIKIGKTFWCGYDTVERHYMTLKYLEIDQEGGGGCAAGILISGHHFTMDDVILYNTAGSGVMLTSSTGANTTKTQYAVIKNSVIHDVRLGGTSGYCVYAQSQDITIEHVECYRAKGWGFHFYTGTSNTPNRAVIRYNYVHDILPGTQIFCGGIVVYGTGHKVYNNVVDIGSTACPSPAVYSGAIDLRGTGSTIETYNNTVQSVAGDGVRISSVATSAIVKNNLFGAFPNGNAVVNSGSAALTATHNGCTGAQFCGSTGKVTISAITGCAPSTTDFTQKSGSSCVDAGVNVGNPYNGGAPDIGAFEVFTFASCEVPFGAANTIRLTFTSNANVLGDVLTTFTARRNGTNNALTGAATKIGDTIVSLPLTTTYGAGDSADWSWASGGFSDHAQIGGTLNQPFLPVTNVACTNNAGGAPTYSLTQAAFQYRGVYGPENTTDIRGPENLASYEVVVNGAARVRIAVTNAVSNAPSLGLVLRYARNGGAYTVMPGSFGADGIAMCANRYPAIGVVSGTSTTSQLSTSGTFVPGAVVLEALAIPTITGLNVGYKTELEHCVAWDETASGTYTFRLYEQSGAALGTYTQTPSAVIVPPRGGGMR